MLLTQADYARSRGVSKQAIGKAVASGKIRLTDGKVDPAEADLNWAGGLQAPPAPVGTGVSRGTIPAPHESRAVRLAYEARREKLEFEERSGKVVPVAEVNAFVAGMIMAVRDEFLRIGREEAGALAQTSDPIKCEEIVNGRVIEALEKLTEYRAAA